MSVNELGNWLGERGLSVFTEALARASCEGLEALLALEEKKLIATLSPAKEKTPRLRHLLGELEALRCPPLPASIRERIVELGPQQLARLAAVVERAATPTLPIGNDGVLPDDKGHLCQPAGGLCTRLDSRLWVRKGHQSAAPRRWYFEISLDPVQIIALPEFAIFGSQSKVLLQVAQSDGRSRWDHSDKCVPQIAMALRKGSQVRMQLLVATGAVSMLNPARRDTLDYEALVMAKEHSLRSYVSQLCFGVRGVVEFAGEQICRLTMGSGGGTRSVVCRGSSLEALLDSLAQTAVNLSTVCGKIWEPFQFVVNELNELFELVGIEPDEAPTGDAQEFGLSPMPRKLEADDDPLEVQLMQVYIITLGTKVAGSGQSEERAQQTVELAFMDVAKALENDSGKQVRVAVKQMTSTSIIVQLAVISAELAEVEHTLATRARSRPGNTGKTEELAKPKPEEDLRAALGISLQGISKSAAGTTPTAGQLPPLMKPSKLSSGEAPLTYRAASPASPASPAFGATRSLTSALTPQMISRPSSPRPSSPRPSSSVPPGALQRPGSLPPMDTQISGRGSKKNNAKQKGLKMAPASVGSLAGKIFQALDFDNSTYLTAAKLQWGFEYVAPIFEFACPGFGPSSFEASDQGSTAHAYFHFLDENQDGCISVKEFSHLFINAAELRPAQAAELEGLLRHAHSQLEKQRLSGAVLCATDGQRSMVARSGQQLEVIYSVFPERVSKIQSAFKCKESLGPRALLALLPTAKVVNSIEILNTTAIAVMVLESFKTSGRAVLGLPQSDVMMRDCAIRIYIVDEGGHQFLQLGESLPCQLRGPPSMQHMASNINAALASVPTEEANQQAARQHREEAYAVLEQIKVNDIRPDIVVAARRELIPRLQQVFCSRTLLRERDLVPLTPRDLSVANLGRNQLLAVDERPRLQWRVVAEAANYLIMAFPDDAPEPSVGPSYSFFVADGQLKKTRLEDEGPWFAQFRVPDLLLGRYSAKVKAQNMHGFGAWSSACSFYSVSAEEVAALESTLHECVASRQKQGLREAVVKAEFYWVVNENVLQRAKECLEVIDLEHSMQEAVVDNSGVGVNQLEKYIVTARKYERRTVLKQDEVDEFREAYKEGKVKDDGPTHREGKAKDDGHAHKEGKMAKPSFGFNPHILLSAQLKFGQLLAAQIQPMLTTAGCLTALGALTSLETMANRLEAIPDHGQEALLEEARVKIQVYRQQPMLQEALDGQDVQKLQQSIMDTMQLCHGAQKQLFPLVNEARMQLRHLSEEAIAKAVKKDGGGYDVLKAAVAWAKSVNESLKVVHSTEHTQAWEENAFAITAKAIREGENHMDFLKFLEHEEAKTRREKKANVEDASW